MRKNIKEFSPPTSEEVAAYAYQLWESEGRQSGRDLDYWFQAEAHLQADRKYEAGLLGAAPVRARRIPKSMGKTGQRPLADNMQGFPPVA